MTRRGNAGLLALFVALLMMPLTLQAQERDHRADGTPRTCDLAGTWFGGGPLTKYLMTIAAAPDGNYTTLGQAAFSFETLGFPVSTVYTGSIERGPGKRYDSYAIGLMNNTTEFPAPAPQVWGVHARIYLTDCNSMRMDYDFFGAYYWPTDKTPFLSEPDYMPVPPPFTETYRRMPTKCTKCG